MGLRDDATEMRTIRNDKELMALHTTGRGLIYNDFSRNASSGTEFNVLHASFCRSVLRMNTNVPKVFFDAPKEAVEWLQRNRRDNWKRCDICKAMSPQ